MVSQSLCLSLASLMECQNSLLCQQRGECGRAKVWRWNREQAGVVEGHSRGDPILCSELWVQHWAESRIEQMDLPKQLPRSWLLNRAGFLVLQAGSILLGRTCLPQRSWMWMQVLLTPAASAASVKPQIPLCRLSVSPELQFCTLPAHLENSLLPRACVCPTLWP